MTWAIPPEDKSYHSIVEYKDVLARILGGRIAEEVVYGYDHVTTGAGNDLSKAAELARDMVINQGMGKKLRDQVFKVDDGMMLDRLVHERDYSYETAKIIDDEVEALIARGEYHIVVFDREDWIALEPQFAGRVRARHFEMGNKELVWVDFPPQAPARAP